MSQTHEPQEKDYDYDNYSDSDGDPKDEDVEGLTAHEVDELMSFSQEEIDATGWTSPAEGASMSAAQAENADVVRVKRTLLELVVRSTTAKVARYDDIYEAIEACAAGKETRHRREELWQRFLDADEEFQKLDANADASEIWNCFNEIAKDYAASKKYAPDYQDVAAMVYRVGKHQQATNEELQNICSAMERILETCAFVRKFAGDRKYVRAIFVSAEMHGKRNYSDNWEGFKYAAANIHGKL